MVVILWTGFLTSCTKLVTVPEPVNTITNAEAFGSDATAESAIAGIYNDLITGHRGIGFNLSFANGLTTLDVGMSADELHIFNGPSPFETNTLNSSNFPATFLWNGPYFDIYLANAAIENLPVSASVSATVRSQLTGEAKFLRAFCYFYLVNFFGDVPLTTTTAYLTTDTLSRAPMAKVYQFMVSDLKDAQQLLASDYAVSDGNRVRVNKAGATALLARVYLYQRDWDSAETAATSVISQNNLYSLYTNLDSVFLANSQESILEWQVPNYTPYATFEASKILPASAKSSPGYYLTGSLLADFETGDLRRIHWVDSSRYAGQNYFYPYKYKVRVGTAGIITENYVVLRLAEQYLIRAEARAEQNNLSGAMNDLNVLRERAGLADLSADLSQTQVLSAIMQERRIEFFAEWGHRWFDLKRTSMADAVLSPQKPSWAPSAKLYPIPATEIVDDGNLVQNPGY